MQQFFYSGQIRRFVVQFMRMVSNFHVEYGRDREGNTSLVRVPVVYGDSSRQAAQILRNNSENTVPHTPAIAVYISNLSYARDRVQEPFHVSKMQVRERKFDADTGTYTRLQQDALSIERLMPVPYTLELKCDIWTSNSTQKLQLFEQMCILFNPSMEIQNTDNYVDWSSLSVVNLVGNTWSSRTVPAGTEDDIDVLTMTFELPIWISPPAKVKKLGVIQKIIANIYDPKGELSDSVFSDGDLISRQYITPLNYGVILLDNQLTLIKPSEIALDDGKIGTPDDWKALVDVYGQLNPGVSQVRLLIDEQGTEVIGTIDYLPGNSNVMLFDIMEDTIPTNTLPPISAIVDPLAVDPDSGITTPAAGTRYLIINDIGFADDNEFAPAWAGTANIELVASSNDIIEYNGNNWFVVFDSQQQTSTQYVTNLNTAIQYKWDGQQWSKSYQGFYTAGRWSLFL
jgi:hypothetical protein